MKVFHIVLLSGTTSDVALKAIFGNDFCLMVCLEYQDKMANGMKIKNYYMKYSSVKT